ncbi:MAG: hypothetical protein LBN27_01140 [Prevotellaceae bacterium]|jgi:hypothetical protein|nr:hypothetical protein [Prevotellaceae bacterium]
MKKNILLPMLFSVFFGQVAFSQAIDVTDLYNAQGDNAIVDAYAAEIDLNSLPYFSASTFAQAPTVKIRNQHLRYYKFHLTETEKFSINVTDTAYQVTAYLYKYGDANNAITLDKGKIIDFPLQDLDEGDYVLNLISLTSSKYFQMAVTPFTDTSSVITWEELSAYAETVEDLLFEKSGQFGQEPSKLVHRQYRNLDYYFFYLPYKYSLREGDVISYSAEFPYATPFLEIYNDNNEELLWTDSVKLTAFKFPADGDYFVYVSPLEQKNYTNYSFALSIIGTIDSITFNQSQSARQKNIIINEYFSEEEIKEKLAQLSVIGFDSYGQEIPFENKAEYWTINGDEATFTPQVNGGLIPFTLAPDINNTISISELTSDIFEVSAEKEILKEEYFGIDGKPLRAKDISPLHIKRTVYTDGTVKVEKVLR